MPTLPPEPDLEMLAANARRKPLALIAKKTRLLKNLASDLEKHGSPEQWKRYGDLLLANVAMARWDSDRFVVTDVFDEEQPEVSIPAERGLSVTEAAEEYFRRYAKARNGLAVINERIAAAEQAITSAERTLTEIDAAVANEDMETLATFGEVKQKPKPAPASKKTRQTDKLLKGVRQFTSTDGYEILVGKKAADNDSLTFRIAKSQDTWLHAADYPGSHVVVRRKGKKDEVPHRTLVEAAELAAFYSDARNLPKAAVNYTLKKFVNKPRKAAPGLVSLASHRSIMVEPRVPFEKPED